MRKCWVLFTVLLLLGLPVYAQETGSISGTITLDDGTDLPGVTVTASGDVLPQNRTVITDVAGEYRFVMLPPGNYELSFELEGMATQARALEVLLERNSVVNVTMNSSTVTDVIEVTAAEMGIDIASTNIQATVSSDVIDALPVGQEYRDFMKLAPGVQYTEDTIRGPSAGGNGQDNVYKLDGVNIGMPLFGVLSSEPAAYDIEQVSFLRGGAKAIDFNRSGGLTMNSVTRSGTNRWRGIFNYQFQTEGMTDSRTSEAVEEFDQDLSWLTIGAGGPILQDKLFFYGSYYRPETTQDSKSNVYGPVPNEESTRNEFFGKLTWTPTSSTLFAGSYRDSDRDGSGAGVGEFSQGTTSEGTDETLVIAYLEGSWLINDRSSLNFKYSDFENKTGSAPDNVLDIPIGPGVNLNINDLEGQGIFTVPTLLDDNPSFNTWAQPVIDRYGFIENGQRVGGGEVGVAQEFNSQNFFREDFSIGYDYYLSNHQLHVGYQLYEVEEELFRPSNGWGWVQPTGGRDSTDDGTGVYYTAQFRAQTLGTEVPPIRSSMESQTIELNDTFTFKNLTFSVGFMFSNDTLFGSGLRETGQGVSGFEVAPGNKYEMYDIGFSEMIQPRLGVTWSRTGAEKVYGSYARYNPAASSLARAASWDRNLSGRTIEARFDINGTYLDQGQFSSSSGKVFQDGLDPRYIDEFIVGYDRNISSRWIARSHFRYRKGRNFWEDTNNTARVDYEPPPGIPRELYVPNLDEIRAEIGGSSYVVAQLDDAFTDYYEVGLESEYRSSKYYIQGSYVWSQYYGNFDQDNTSSANDASRFIGSSNLADGAGRQVWDSKYGYLRGDRRHQLKLYGYYNLNWNATTGAYLIYQDGQPWEAWDVEVYREFTGSTNNTIRFAEPAGSNRTDSHVQLDLNYTQNFGFGSRFNLRLMADLFNVLDNQTGYNVQPSVNDAGFGDPRTFFNPRRLQLAIGLDF